MASKENDKKAEWPRKAVSEVCSLIVDCVNKTAPKVEHETPYKMIRTTNVRNGKVNLTDCKYVEEDTFKKWTRRADVMTGDVLLTREAPIGEVGYVNTNENVFLGQRLMQYRADLKKLDPRFLLYAFLSPDLKHQFGMHDGTGSVVSHIRVGDCSKFTIPYPPLETQQAIAHILGTLDDKIELDQRMNETLEAMAQALFKSWFVDFDPVKAKMEGKQPEGMDADTAALFPDKLVESELGLIPEGWNVACLKDVATNIRETVKPKDLHDTVPYIGLEHMPKKSIALSQWEYADKVTSNKSRFKGGDFLFGKLRPYFHKVGIAVIDGICSTDILVIRPMDENYYSFVISYISSEEFIDYTDRLSNGAKMPRTNWKDMGKYPIPLPSAEIARCFLKVVKPLYEKIARNIYQTKELSAARDALLPKLISGQIDTESQT